MIKHNIYLSRTCWCEITVVNMFNFWLLESGCIVLVLLEISFKRNYNLLKYKLMPFVRCLTELMVYKTNLNDFQRIQLWGLLKILIRDSNIIKELHWYCQLKTKNMTFNTESFKLYLRSVQKTSFESTADLGLLHGYNCGFFQ